MPYFHGLININVKSSFHCYFVQFTHHDIITDIISKCHWHLVCWYVFINSNKTGCTCK